MGKIRRLLVVWWALAGVGGAWGAGFKDAVGEVSGTLEAKPG